MEKIIRPSERSRRDSGELDFIVFFSGMQTPGLSQLSCASSEGGPEILHQAGFSGLTSPSTKSNCPLPTLLQQETCVQPEFV